MTLIALLALSDSGRPSYDADHAIERQDIGRWAAQNDLVATVPD